MPNCCASSTPDGTGQACSRPPRWCSLQRHAIRSTLDSPDGCAARASDSKSNHGASGTSQVSIRPGCSPSACTSSCFVGSPDGARTHRELWLDRATQLLDGLGLTVDVVPASDPSFGWIGRMLASSQRDEQLRYEIVTPIISPDAPTAVASANHHHDHFARPFEIAVPDGAIAHSAASGSAWYDLRLALLRTTDSTKHAGWRRDRSAMSLNVRYAPNRASEPPDVGPTRSLPTGLADQT